MERIKFFLDEHIPHAVCNGLKLRGITALTCTESGRLGFTDEEHIEYSKKEGFVIVTADTDFLTLHSTGVEHSGIAFASRPLNIGQFVNALLLIYEVLSPEDMLNHIEFI